MKRSIKITLITLITGATLTAGAAYGHRYYNGKGCNPADRLTDRISQELELDNTQSAQLETLKQRMLSVKEDMRAQRGEAWQKVAALFEGESMNRKGAQSLVDEKIGSINNLAPQLITEIGDFYDSLSTQQQQRLRDKVSERVEYRHRHW